jgi:6-phosphogluconolactonase
VSPHEVAGEVARAFAELALDTLSRQPRFTCAVPGGSVATTVFPELARLSLPWPRVDVFLADERFVEPSSPDSNARAVVDFWLRPMTPPEPIFHPMPTAGEPDEAAWLAALDLADRAGQPPRLDLVMLGVGPDGHVASLFPEHEDWRTRREWVIAVRDAPKPPPTRLSLGLQAIASARHVWFVAFGADKTRAIAAARTDAASALPAAVVARHSQGVRWFLDAAAAATPSSTDL